MLKRRVGVVTLGTVALVLAGVCSPVAPAAGKESTPGELILRAGEAGDDGERLAVLKRLASHARADDRLRADATKMAAAVERWITSKRLDYFGGRVIRNKDWDFGVGADSPLWPIARFYRARMLVWVVMEHGGLQRDPARRRPYLSKAVGDFQAVARAFPGNRIATMYLGRAIPWKKDLPGADGAPQWAALQREGLERLADIVTWWIDKRMQADGQYGGGWGDDCEMWRWWVPVLIAFDDPKITAAQAKFSAALMAQPHMKKGYTSRMTDVEHTAEDSADVITPMMHLRPDDPAWRRRAMRLAELMETLWTGANGRGQLQYKSTYFTVDRVDDRPDRACDTVYHPRAVQPALLLWQRTGDKRLGRLFSAWMNTWVDATARAERGKPAGIIPSAIHWPEGRVGGTHDDWWDPHNHGEPGLYRWPSAMSMMCNTMLLTWHMTGEERYLAPLRSMAAARLRYLRGRPASPPKPGTEAWCASELGFLAGTLAKYRSLSGGREFDELLGLDDPAGAALRSRGGRKALVAALRANAEALRVNKPGYTSEVRYTDRVLRFARLFGAEMMFRRPTGNFRSPDPDLLYRTATGDPGRAGYFPLNAVRWHTPPRNIAALVTQTTRTHFAAELYHFGEKPRKMAATLYLLKPGRYQMHLRANTKTIATRILNATGRQTHIEFELLPRQLCTLSVKRCK